MLRVPQRTHRGKHRSIGAVSYGATGPTPLATRGTLARATRPRGGVLFHARWITLHLKLGDTMTVNRRMYGDRQRVQLAVLAIDFVLGALYGPKRCFVGQHLLN